ncbi:hypothetical protein [Haladaptatus halobius]|uniref:hypothetical protein n=1 Tax=Haladaptatus halobius TaxID=2884875 RepID=UPI001D0B650B|nr:hypothetical protein [Haladaptatus halobius]
MTKPTRYDRTEVEGPTVPNVSRRGGRPRSTDEVDALKRELVTIHTRLDRIEATLQNTTADDR